MTLYRSTKSWHTGHLRARLSRPPTSVEIRIARYTGRAASGTASPVPHIENGGPLKGINVLDVSRVLAV